MELSIIIINWNSKDFLRDCLKSVVPGASGLTHEILVIDNASHDGTAQMVVEEFPQVKFIQSEHNLGFSGGNNLAVRQAKGDFLLFLNPDTVVQDDALMQLVQALRREPKAGAVGARLLNSDRTLQTSCVLSFPTAFNQVFDCEVLRRWFPRSALWGMAALFNDSPEPQSVEAVSGACLMVKHELFETIGGFNELYFMYCEDVDMCFGIHQVGYKCYYVPGAILIHHGGSSSQKARNAFSSVMMRESVYRFLLCHRGWASAICYRFCLILSSMARISCVTIAALFKRGSVSAEKSVINKWSAILRWSVGSENWSKTTASKPAQANL